MALFDCCIPNRKKIGNHEKICYNFDEVGKKTRVQKEDSVTEFEEVYSCSFRYIFMRITEVLAWL